MSEVTPTPTLNTDPKSRWLTTARHRARYGSPEPYGTRHAQRVGAATTVCGLPSLQWPVFWDLPFHSRLVDACPICVEYVRTHEVSRPRS